MPIQIAEQVVTLRKEQEDVLTVNAVKISLLEIDVLHQKIVVRLQLGNLVDGVFTPIPKMLTIFIAGDEFMEMAQMVVNADEVGKSMYDLIAEKTYSWLKSKGKI